MKLQINDWNLAHLRAHLQHAVDLEVWTIPFYMSAMFSIRDRSSDAFQMIQSIVNQEMLHVQFASNVCNAYGLSPKFPTPVYGKAIPYLDFDLDKDDPRKEFHPYTTEIGPFDAARLNAMCLIEFPEFDTGTSTDFSEDVNDYGSIGEFYDAVEFGAKQLSAHIRGGVNQIDLFSAYYRNLPKLTVEDSGPKAISQVALLIDAVRDQGEGRKSNERILPAFQNTADDSKAALSHFDKFVTLRNAPLMPETYPLKCADEITDRDRTLQQILAENFAKLLGVLEASFNGRRPDDFESVMVTVGGNIMNCWKNGVLPTFTQTLAART